jgi:hypothetical protein
VELIFAYFLLWCFFVRFSARGAQKHHKTPPLAPVSLPPPLNYFCRLFGRFSARAWDWKKLNNTIQIQIQIK